MTPTILPANLFLGYLLCSHSILLVTLAVPCVTMKVSSAGARLRIEATKKGRVQSGFSTSSFKSWTHKRPVELGLLTKGVADIVLIERSCRQALKDFASSSR